MIPGTIGTPAFTPANVHEVTSSSFEPWFADLESSGGALLGRRGGMQHLSCSRTLDARRVTTTAVDEIRSRRRRTFDDFEPAMEPR